MVRLTQDFKVLGLGKLPKRRRENAISMVAEYAGTNLHETGQMVDRIADIAGKDLKLTPKERKQAIEYVMRTWRLDKRQAGVIVRKTLEHVKIHGGKTFWETLADLGTGLFKNIPIVGNAISEGISSLREKRAYDFNKAVGGKKPQRCVIVSRVMKSHPGMSVGEASKFVKDNGLYKPQGGGKKVQITLPGSSVPREGATAPRRSRRIRGEPPVVVHKTKQVPCDAMSRRGKLVKAIMELTGWPLVDASAYIKQNGLWSKTD